MAILDNELGQNINRDNRSFVPNPYIQSPTQMDIDTSVHQSSGSAGDSKIETGLSLDEIANFTTKERGGFSSPFQSIPRSELIANQRYPLYRRSVDLENIYGLQQSWYDRMGNSLVKFGATTLGTFLQSFGTIPNTIEAIRNGDISALSGAPDGYEASIDKWLKNLEDAFPNYYSQWEREHPFRAIIPFTTGSANFWGDKVIKNLGFTAGAIAGALAQDAIITTLTGGSGTIPLISAQVGKASLWLNKIFAGANKVDDVLRGAAKIDDAILSLSKLKDISFTTKLGDGFKYSAALYGSARTEAAVEARDSREKVKEELIRQYKLENLGQDPSFADLQVIEKYADSAMNTRFGVNMALLTLSNAVQFGNLFKSFTATNKALQSANLSKLGIGLKEGSLDVFEKTATGNKVWNFVSPVAKNIVAEGIYEEGGQFATEKGVYDYYTRKYKSAQNAEVWNDLNETISSTVEGLRKQFGTEEGLENMIIGGITAVLAGGVSSRIEKARGMDIDSRAKVALNVLNRYGLTGILSQQYDNTLNSMSIAKEMDEAVKAGDIYKYNNLKNDMFFTYVMSRIPSGMHEVTVEQLNMLKELPKEEFEKTFGMDFNNQSKNTVAAYVDNLISEANHIKKVSDGINKTFKNPFVFNTNPQNPEQELENKKHLTFENWKTDLTYYGSVSKQINNRIQDIQSQVSKIDPNVSVSLLASLAHEDSLREFAAVYEEKAANMNNRITDLTSVEDRRSIRNDVKRLRTLAEKIKLSVNSNTFNSNLFNELLNFELNGQDFSKEKVVGLENTVELFNLGVDVARLNGRKKKAAEQYEALASEEGFNKYFEQESQVKPTEKPKDLTEEEKSAIKFKNSQGEEEKVEIGRTYATQKAKQATVKKLADDRFEVTDALGNLSYYKTKEEANEAAKEINEELQDTSSLTVLDINPDGTLKVQDTLGNIYDVAPSKIEGYEKTLTEQEQLKEKKEKIDKQQQEIAKDSATVGTNSPEVDLQLVQTEDLKKDASWLFTSTTSISEDSKNETLKPHHLRHIEFLNNAKNFKNRSDLKVILVTKNQQKALGLDGIVQLSALQGTEEKDLLDVNTGVLVAVYVQQKGSEIQFVNKEGEPIGKVGEPVDLNSVVFSTMPNTHLYWNDGKTARYRKEQEEEAKEQSKRWEAKRKQLFSLPEDKYEIYGFVISRGIPSITDKAAKNHVSDSLVPNEKIATLKGLIQIPTTGTVSHMGKTLKFPNGRPVLSYGDTLQFVNNNQFTPAQAKALYAVILEISNYIREHGELPIKLNKFLQNVLFYKKPEKGVAVKNNQFWIDTDTMNIVFGNLIIDITKVEENREALIEKLEGAYNAINNKTLNDSFEEPFVEYYLEDNSLKTRQWANYQTYLLSATYPDGKKRNADSTPITTNVDKLSGTTRFNFKQKYAILQEIELPPLSVKPAKTEVTKEAPAPSGFVLDGKTVNTIKLNSGPLQFTATQEEDEYNINILEGEVIPNIVGNSALVAQIVAALKQGNLFDPAMTDLQIVQKYLINLIVVQLNKSKPPKEVKTTSVEDFEISLNFVSDKDLVKVTKGAKERRDSQKEIKTKLQSFNDLVKCLSKS